MFMGAELLNLIDSTRYDVLRSGMPMGRMASIRRASPNSSLESLAGQGLRYALRL